ncbi:MAG: hypothetical protein J2P37_09435 [Ktedonobacteraceae bacterium]|nr:hypothetical protein [Ktedonobacteraceae bacterium]
MAVRISRRLPGVRFEVQPPLLTDVLPRMDVAVFVGFATSGPLHTPVVVEDVAQFTAIFGEDKPLAWDVQRGEVVYTYLAAAVRAFFRNGGRRCWVIRVAGNAQYNAFRIPGLKQVHLDDSGSISEITDAYARACSEGSWSDGLRVAATLLSQSYAIEQFLLEQLQVDLTLVASPPSEIVVGDLLRLTFRELGYMLMFVVRSTQAQVVDEYRVVRVQGETPIWLQLSSSPPGFVSPPEPEEAEIIGPPPSEIIEQLHVDTIDCERLNVELWVKQGDAYPERLSNLGFAPGHPNYWDALPTDQQLYQDTTAQPAPAQYAGLWDAVRNPRFPLAGRNAGHSFSIPIAMPVQPDYFSGPKTQPATPLERDGLSVFDASLFLDPALSASSVTDVLTQADFIRYQSASPRSLIGIHAALEIEEATLIAVPDAVHRGWQPFHVPVAPNPLSSSPPQHPEWWHTLDCDPLPVIPSAREPEWGYFLNCDIRNIGVPQLYKDYELDEVSAGTFRLNWTTPEADASYTLEEATTPDFSGAVVIGGYTPATNFVTIYGRSPGDYYYRVRAEVGDVPGDWSNGVVVRVASELRWRLNMVEEYVEGIVRMVQRALLRMCAARGDMLAVMALPEHYREDAAIQHATALTSPAGPAKKLAEVEANVLSYGALYHPWLNGREEDVVTEVRRTPPDGAMCGIMARRAIARGAWIAPANEVVRGVVSLTPAIARAHWLRLQEAQINLVRQEARGFLTFSADTLSSDPTLRPINVRRLLILLRRLALRLGTAYVFEPNSDAFRRLVQRNFEAMLGQMFARGAFAGSTPQTAFQVITDRSLNTPQNVDAGRFIVELRVSPSLPMTFLTVRLVQTGERSIVTEGS